MEGTIINLEKGQILMKEGEVSKDIFWLIKGKLIVEKQYMTDKVNIGYVEQGELVGELAFIDNKPRSATVKACEESQVARLDYSEFKVMFEAQPKWMRKLLSTLAIRLRKMSDF